jgi:hypothetical protein
MRRRVRSAGLGYRVAPHIGSLRQRTATRAPTPLDIRHARRQPVLVHRHAPTPCLALQLRQARLKLGHAARWGFGQAQPICGSFCYGVLE